MRILAASGVLALLLGCGGNASAPKSETPPPEREKKGDGGGSKSENQLDLKQKQASKGSEELDKDAPGETGARQSSDEPVHAIDLATLLGEYQMDEPAADRAYRTKLVEVRGVVETIEGAVVILTAPGATLRCRCAFPGGFGDGVTMNPGLEIRVRGRVKGKQADVLLEECRLRQ